MPNDTIYYITSKGKKESSEVMAIASDRADDEELNRLSLALHIVTILDVDGPMTYDDLVLREGSRYEHLEPYTKSQVNVALKRLHDIGFIGKDER